MQFHNAKQQQTFQKLVTVIEDYYGNDLISLVLYGSYARGEARLNSDWDLLIVLKEKKRRGVMFEEFYDHIEKPLDKDLKILYEEYGIDVALSPLFLTQDEAGYFNPLYFDMLKASEVLTDRKGFFRNILNRTKRIKKEHHCHKVINGNSYVWDFGSNQLIGARI